MTVINDAYNASPEAMAALECFPWPGNIRQLENIVQQAVLLSSGPELLVEPDRLAGALEIPQAAQVLVNVINVDQGAEQRNGIGNDGCGVLAAPVRKLARFRIEARRRAAISG